MTDQTAFGGALLRVLGAADRQKGTPSPATKGDALGLIDVVMSSKEMRERCGALSSLVQDAAVEARQETCRALVILMQSRTSPREPPPQDPHGNPDKTKFLSTNIAYAQLCAPVPHGAWSDHVEAKYKKAGSAEFCLISPYLFEMIAALEALLNVQGHLLKR